jgi:hypothetical protein
VLRPVVLVLYIPHRKRPCPALLLLFEIASRGIDARRTVGAIARAVSIARCQRADYAEEVCCERLQCGKARGHDSGVHFDSSAS